MASNDGVVLSRARQSRGKEHRLPPIEDAAGQENRPRRHHQADHNQHQSFDSGAAKKFVIDPHHSVGSLVTAIILTTISNKC